MTPSQAERGQNVLTGGDNNAWELMVLCVLEGIGRRYLSKKESCGRLLVVVRSCRLRKVVDQRRLSCVRGQP